MSTFLDYRNYPTAQAIFDAVWDWFIIQRKPRSLVDTDPEAACLYRSPDGNACAVGIFIPDSEYRPGMEGLPATQLAALLTWPFREWVSDNRNLLADLQIAHDMPCSEYFERFQDRLRQVARRYSLVEPKEVV